MPFPLPRFERLSRRQFLQRSAAVGGLGAAALLPSLGCSNDDRQAFDEVGSTTSSSTDDGTVASSANDTGDDTDDDTDDAATASTATGSTVPAVGNPIPAGAQLTVSFSYTAADGGGRVRNPYIAVWVEDTAGELVQTISVWYKAQESKYLDHLKRWYHAEATLLDNGGTDNLDAVSGATRTAGDYQLLWDGTDVDGNTVAQGQYVLCIEAAREHGPYQLVTGDLTLADQPFELALAANGELTGGSVEFVV